MPTLSFLCLLALGILHLIVATSGQSQECSRGFGTFSVPRGDDDDRRKKRQSSRQAHYIVPFMNFSCDGTITEIEFAASFAEERRGTIDFEVWRPVESSSGTITLFSSVTDVRYTGMLDDDDGGHARTSVVVPMSVSSGDVLGIYVINTRSLNILTSSKNDDFTVYQLKDGSSTKATANIPSSYDSSSSYSPLVSVSFVPEPTETSTMTTEPAMATDDIESTSMSSSSTSTNPSTDIDVSSPADVNPSVGVSSSADVNPSVGVSSSAGVNPSFGVSSAAGASSSVGVSPSFGVSSSADTSSSAGVSSSTDVQLSSSVLSVGTANDDKVQTSEGSDAPGAINVGVIVGAVLAGIVLIVIAMALVGCIVFLLYPKVTKEKQYVMFARFRRDTSNVELVRTRRRDVTSMITLNSVQLAEYDDPEAYVAGLPYEQPLLTTAPPLPPSNDKKVDVYEPMTMQTGDNLIVTNPHAISGGYETVVRQEDPVSGVVLTSNGQTALYDTMTDGGQPMQVVYETIESQYDYVPDEVSRRQGTLPRRPTGLEEELKRIYEGVTRSEYEDIPFVPPGEKLNTLYDQLANKKCIEIPRVYLKQESVLGTGEFGDVFKGVWETPYGPQDVAMKMLKSGSNEKDKINFLKEAALMGQFRHPHVIRLLGTVTVDDPCIIVLEFLPKKDLESYLQERRPEPGILPESSLPLQLLKFCCEIADGMKYLSNKSFIHRDLATRNVLLDKNLQCKIADFGLSKTLQSDSEYYIAKGGRVPVRWTAPEALHYKKYTISSDVWSFGMTMYEIWSLGEKPFSQMDALNVVKKLQKEVSYVQPPPPGCPRDMYRLMVYCWDRNHHSRPTFGAIFGVLSGPPDSLLLLPSDDLQQTKDPSKAGQLGMPLEFGEDLYQDLQHYYNSDEA